MTEQARPPFTDTRIEKMLIERAGPGAPADLVRAIATAVESTGQRAPGLLGALSGPAASRTRRGPRRTWLFVAATLLVGTGVIGASLFGSRLVAPVPVPSAGPTSSVVPVRAASWTATGSMGTRRGSPATTLLPDGKVLVAGGDWINDTLASAELYDPGAGSWAATGDMTEGRVWHTATLLRDGKVLVAGGKSCCDPGKVPETSAELYDPGTGTWTATGSMNTPRFEHTATLLPDGKVLVAGGLLVAGGDCCGKGTSAELYDPGTGTWTATGSMNTPRSLHTATLLPDGRVLVTGGDVGRSAELYDPGTGSWTATGSMVARHGGPATLLLNGRVLVAGHWDGDIGPSAELYDPGSGTWAATGDMTEFRVGHTATLLLDGRVLVADGQAPGGALSSAELYDPSTGTWTAAGDTWWPGGIRGGATATLLLDGRVLLFEITSAELYDPGSGR